MIYQEKNKSQSYYFESNGLKLHYRKWGNQGPIAVLLHGWMDASSSFQFFVDALQNEWQIYSLDWPGMGLSEHLNDMYYDRAEYFVHLKRFLDIIASQKKVHFLGHSLGGMILSQFVPSFEERALSLTIAEGMGITDGTLRHAPQKLKTFIEDVEKPKTFRLYKDYEEFAQKLMHQNPQLQKEENQPRALYLSYNLMKEVYMDEEGQTFDVESVQNPSNSYQKGVVQKADIRHRISQPIPYRYEWIRESLKQIKLEVLLLQGHFLPHNHYLNQIKNVIDDRYSDIQNSKLIVYEHSGHMIQWEAYEEMARDVEAYWLRMNND